MYASSCCGAWKVRVATTIEDGFVVGIRAMPGNPYDGHTLAETLEQVEILTDQRLSRPGSPKNGGADRLNG